MVRFECDSGKKKLSYDAAEERNWWGMRLGAITYWLVTQTSLNLVMKSVIKLQHNILAAIPRGFGVFN